MDPLPDTNDDWASSVASASSPPELTTVGSDHAVVFEGHDVRRYDGLASDSAHEVEGFAFRTLPLRGELLCTFATVNDVHLGEQTCGVIEGSDIGPTFANEPDAEPYAEMMNRAAVAEITALEPDAVVVKGDLTSTGSRAEYDLFRSIYEPAFGERLTVVRGNHESYFGSDFAAEPFQEVALPGVRLAVLDTSVDRSTPGTVTGEQLDWLDDLAQHSDRPVLVFGHHHLGDPDSSEKADRTFGIDLDASSALLALVSRRPSIRGYFCGHTHRNRVRRFAQTGDVPWAEVASVKEYPGAWAEYRVHEGAVLQVFRRITAPAALAWSEKTRHMYAGLYHDYSFGTLQDRCFAISLD